MKSKQCLLGVSLAQIYFKVGEYVSRSIRIAYQYRLHSLIKLNLYDCSYCARRCPAAKPGQQFGRHPHVFGLVCSLV